MPMYEYICPKCKFLFEEIKSFNEPNPVCIKGCKDGKNNPIKTKKIISKTNFRLKGRGWAKDGYTGSNF